MGRAKPGKEAKTVPDQASKKPNEPSANASRELDLRTLEAYLPHVYKALADTYADAGGELNSYIVQEYLPVQAFEIAVRCEWVSPVTYRPSNRLPPGTRIPPEGVPMPNVTTIGRWLVTVDFCNEFDRIIQPAISALRQRLAASGSSKWQHPTPAEYVQIFLDDTRWPKSRLIDKMADKMSDKHMNYGDPAQAAKKQLGVITKEPLSPTFLKDYHVLLCEVMQENCPKFTGIKPMELVWRYPA